jgi:hypothetical protein
MSNQTLRACLDASTSRRSQTSIVWIVARRTLLELQSMYEKSLVHINLSLTLVFLSLVNEDVLLLKGDLYNKLLENLTNQ